MNESFFQHVENFFKDAGKAVSDIFIKLFGKQAALTFAHASILLLKTDLGEVAMAAVKAADSLATDAEKHAAAFKSIETEAVKLGKSAGTSEINMLIELAVQAITGAFGVAA